jgi:hypothetical protein
MEIVRVEAAKKIKRNWKDNGVMWHGWELIGLGSVWMKE